MKRMAKVNFRRWNFCILLRVDLLWLLLFNFYLFLKNTEPLHRYNKVFSTKTQWENVKWKWWIAFPSGKIFLRIQYFFRFQKKFQNTKKLHMLFWIFLWIFLINEKSLIHSPWVRILFLRQFIKFFPFKNPNNNMVLNIKAVCWEV